MRLLGAAAGLVGAAAILAGACTATSTARPYQLSKDRLDADPVSTAPVTSHPPRVPVVRLSAVGDTILGNTPDVPSNPAGYLAPIRRALRWRANIVFGNLEGTLTTASHSKCGSKSSECFAFRNPPGFAHAFARTGFTILNDANNHSHDFGSAGLRQTVSSIRAAGMSQTGLPGEITFVKAGTTRVAVLAFAPYSNTADLLDLGKARSLIRRAVHHARLVVVYMHAGAEGSGADHVTGHEEYFVGEDRGNPQRFAHMAIRAGADLVIASGPHVMRGMEFYRNRLIAYSLGNFANFHNFSGGGDLVHSGILHVTLTSGGRFVTGQLVSVRLGADGQARRGPGSIDFVRSLSKQDFGSHAARLARDGTIRPPA